MKRTFVALALILAASAAHAQASIGADPGSRSLSTAGGSTSGNASSLAIGGGNTPEMMYGSDGTANPARDGESVANAPHDRPGTLTIRPALDNTPPPANPPYPAGARR